MKDQQLQLILKTCLDRFEEHEIELLSWGDTESFFNKSEVDQIIIEVLGKFPSLCFTYDIDTIFLALIDQAMLIEVPYSDKAMTNSGLFRSRMGESVHLFKLQRQLFWGKKLEDSKTLVSDFRFVRRPRSYPRRDVEPKQLKNQFSQESFNKFLPILEHLVKDNFKLAGFQERSLRRILEEYQKQQKLDSKKSYSISGSIICAGTGSGKTMSFYLPGLTALVDHLCIDSKPGVRILAIYPRNELLKDQFNETWKQCRELDSYTKAKLGRKLRIGTLFGDTPFSIKTAKKNAIQNNIERLDFDLIYCSTPNCSGKMQWSLSDINLGIERLCCSKCNSIICDDEVLLTREAQRNNPPDILFTTTEMLNQQLVNSNYQHLYGIGDQVQKPLMVLMDEVHTYEGSTGAQTAYLLRRWLKMSKARPHFVGLSATLSDAANFFATLIGVQSNQVVLLEPSLEEMVDEGAEYILLLRGDPVSQTALLSTTIQTTMLTSRILDNKQKKSNGSWGNKTFVFTDDLDVINRMYVGLLDAEGWKLRYGKVEPNLASKGRPLAAIRAIHESLHEQRKRKQISFGQDWRISTAIGHSLSEDDRARIGRTSSQDSGVDSNAEVIVATASLEVGFNDPEVGAVIQHKAPRGVASFLQRKGRAGRSREMRPWLIVVLSEFGRDRYMFQRYEELLNPRVKRRSLPLDNRHIQKMQASMALLDWLSLGVNGSIWSILKNPKSSFNSSALLNIAEKLENLVDDQYTFERFKWYLKDALRIDDNVLEQILWESPRSLMLSVIPSILRLIKTNWRINNKEWEGIPHGRSPLPEFIPEALFADLNVPEVGIYLARGKYQEWESLGFYQGMREFAPGRLSKRYAVTGNFCDWLIPKDFNPKTVFDGDYPFDISEAFGNDLFDEGITDVDESVLSIYRPKEIHTQVLDHVFQLKDKSNAQIQWRVSFSDESTRVEIPPKGIWSEHLLNIKICLHKNGTPVQVTRFAHETHANIELKSGDKRRINFQWYKDGLKVAIGAKQWVDGICFSFKVLRKDLDRIIREPEILKSMRILLFKRRINQSKCILGDQFKANWVFECYMAALAMQLPEFTSSTSQELIHQAVNHLSGQKGQQILKSVPLSLFHSDIKNDDSEQVLQKDLISFFDNLYSINELTSAAGALWQNVEVLEDLISLMQEVVENTLAAACSETVYTLLNDADEHAILVDIQHSKDEIQVWISESEQGGCGILENLADLYVEDPRRVLNVFMRQFKEGEYTQIDDQLNQLLLKLRDSKYLQDLFYKIRIANDHQERKEANLVLQDYLLKEGFVLHQSFLNLLYTRILRPGSSAEKDGELLSLFEDWQDLENQTGLEWALNIFTHTKAYFVSKIKEPGNIFDLHCGYQSVLWPRGQVVRGIELSFYNPFNSNNLTERLIFKYLFSEKICTFQINNENLDELYPILVEHGVVDLLIPKSIELSVARIMMLVQEKYLDYHGLWLYPRVIGIYHETNGVTMRIELVEAII